MTALDGVTGGMDIAPLRPSSGPTPIKGSGGGGGAGDGGGLNPDNGDKSTIGPGSSHGGGIPPIQFPM